MGLGSLCFEKKELIVRAGARGGEIPLQIPGDSFRCSLCLQNGHNRMVWASWCFVRINFYMQ